MIDKRQAAKLAALAGTLATAAPFLLPHIPAEHHALAGSLIALLAALSGGAMKSPISKKIPQAGNDAKTFPVSGK